MVIHVVRAAALAAMFAGCGNDNRAAVVPDAQGAQNDALPTPDCVRAGTSSVTGSGPTGSLARSRVYAWALYGCYPDEIKLLVTTGDPLASQYGSDAIEIRVPLLGVNVAAPWSGTFAATLARPAGLGLASGTVQVDQATSASELATSFRATARFDDAGWQFTATIDAPYCGSSACLLPD